MLQYITAGVDVPALLRHAADVIDKLQQENNELRARLDSRSAASCASEPAEPEPATFVPCSSSKAASNARAREHRAPPVPSRPRAKLSLLDILQEGAADDDPAAERSVLASNRDQAGPSASRGDVAGPSAAPPQPSRPAAPLTGLLGALFSTEDSEPARESQSRDRIILDCDIVAESPETRAPRPPSPPPLGAAPAEALGSQAESESLALTQPCDDGQRQELAPSPDRPPLADVVAGSQTSADDSSPYAAAPEQGSQGADPEQQPRARWRKVVRPEDGDEWMLGAAGSGARGARGGSPDENAAPCGELEASFSERRAAGLGSGGKNNNPERAALVGKSTNTEDGKTYKYRDVGFSCQDCARFYRALATWEGPRGAKLPEMSCSHGAAQGGAQMAMEFQQAASRHRFVFEPPPSPKGFWELNLTPSPARSRVSDRGAA
ncbi:hypothetical protein H632_c204p2 [Helicosporidium sp. ATCC 50920]|nr:hypothetical protein H632_c204p2 [Helicosporidium sp. ATCC 50920]|eukprot:KDD76501.1 hypothetical protein H632_c204p2 [Helicosporidium sp. ATCC 50920]